MGPGGKQLAVQQGHLDVGYLQTAQQNLNVVRQVAILQDEVEQHGHQVDGVFVFVAGTRRFGISELGDFRQQQVFQARGLFHGLGLCQLLRLQNAQGVDQIVGFHPRSGGNRRRR